MNIPYKMPEGKNCAAGIGSALVDLCLAESADFVQKSGAQMGGMVMVDYTHIEDVLTKTGVTPSVVPGGSACNTIVGMGKLGMKTRFVGKRGNDMLGDRLEDSLIAAGVEPVLITSQEATGRVLSIVTPDAQRSMLTCLGASAQIRPDEIKPAYFEDCAVVHIEGYLLFNPDVFKAAIKAAKDVGALVSLDLASFTVVEASRNLIDEVLDAGLIDILIANEDETAMFTGIRDDEERAADALGKRAPLAVMNRGKRGSVIMHGGAKTQVGIHGDGRPAVDTTGAGDLWIAGFLTGLLRGLPLDKCGKLAAACGYEVCQTVGAHIPSEAWERIHQLV